MDKKKFNGDGVINELVPERNFNGNFEIQRFKGFYLG